MQSAQRTGGSRTRRLVQALAAGACCVPGGGCHHHHMYLVYPPCRSGPSSHLVQHSPAAAAWMAAEVAQLAQLAQLAGLMLGHAGSCQAHAAACTGCGTARSPKLPSGGGAGCSASWPPMSCCSGTFCSIRSSCKKTSFSFLFCCFLQNILLLCVVGAGTRT